MITREVLKTEIDKVQDEYLEKGERQSKVFAAIPSLRRNVPSFRRNSDLAAKTNPI